MANDKQEKRKLTAAAEKKKNLPESSKKQKKSPAAEPGGCFFVGEPVPAETARKRWPERYENQVWVSVVISYVICFAMLFFF